MNLAKVEMQSVIMTDTIMTNMDGIELKIYIETGTKMADVLVAAFERRVPKMLQSVGPRRANPE